MSLNSSQRAEAEKTKAAYEQALSTGETNDLKAMLMVISKMLMAYPSAAMTNEMIEARAESYLDAVLDLPPWAVAQAVKSWNRGECGERNYNFAPAPAILRETTKQILEPYRQALSKIDAVLNALTLDRAMDSTPLPPTNLVIPRLRRV